MNENLEKRIAALEQWKNQKTARQISFPIDVQSLSALDPFYLRAYTFRGATTDLNASSLGNTTLASSLLVIGGVKTYRGFISVGEETSTNQGGDESSLNTQIIIENTPSDASLNSFLYGYRKPIYKPIPGTTVTVTSAGNTMTDSTKNWVVNELAGAMINITNSSGVFQFSRQIASNTATIVTIDGTWPSTVSGGTYFIYMPVFLGSSNYPWRQIYAGGTDVSAGGDGSVRRAIRIGYGTTGGTETVGIFFGTNTPEGVVTANVGSLFLRTDGGATTTLYVKTSGTSNTGWTAK